MIFNGVVNVLDIDVVQPEGAKHLELVMVLGLGVPMGGQQIGIVPAATIRAPLADRGGVETLAEKLKEYAEKMPKPSNLEVASNLSEVEAAAREFERMRDGGPTGQN